MEFIIAAAVAIGLKFAGYTFAGSILRARHPSTAVPAMGFSFFRTVLGMLLGVLAAFAGGKAVTAGLAFVFLILIVHVTAWFLALLASPGRSIGTRALLTYTGIGTAWSLVLDVPFVLLGLGLGHVFTMCFNSASPGLLGAA
jgi:hypothetical protein